MSVMAEKQPPKPDGLQVMPKDLDLDEKQQFEYGFRQLSLYLKHYSPFSEWLARNGRT